MFIIQIDNTVAAKPSALFLSVLYAGLFLVNTQHALKWERDDA